LPLDPGISTGNYILPGLLKEGTLPNGGCEVLEMTAERRAEQPTKLVTLGRGGDCEKRSKLFNGLRRINLDFPLV
jgi:hypothetical protein